MLERQGRPIAEERSARRDPLSDDAALALLARARRVRIARGRKVDEMPAGEASLADLKGPTGNYRAPLVLAGSTLLVGFQPDSLTELL